MGQNAEGSSGNEHLYKSLELGLLMASWHQLHLYSTYPLHSTLNYIFSSDTTITNIAYYCYNEQFTNEETDLERVSCV